MLRYKRSGSQLHLVKEHVKEHGREGGWVHSSTRNDNPGRMSSGELGYSVNGVSTKGHMRKACHHWSPLLHGKKPAGPASSRSTRSEGHATVPGCVNGLYQTAVEPKESSPSFRRQKSSLEYHLIPCRQGSWTSTRYASMPPRAVEDPIETRFIVCRNDDGDLDGDGCIKSVLRLLLVKSSSRRRGRDVPVISKIPRGSHLSANLYPRNSYAVYDAQYTCSALRCRPKAPRQRHGAVQVASFTRW